MSGTTCPECATEYWDDYCHHCYMPVLKHTVKVGNRIVAKIVMLADEYSPLYEDKLGPVLDALIEAGTYNAKVVTVEALGANTVGWE